MKQSAAKDRLAVFDEAKKNARRVERQVRALADVMADIMAEFNNVPYRVYIDHEDGFVVVRPK